MRERNRGLDGLRGYAAVAVIFYHCLGERFLKTPKLLSASSLHDVVERLAVAIFNGSTAVTVFFVMSGAVLMNSLQHQQGNISRLAIRFVTDRFFRIYPALFVSVLICAIVFYVTGQPRSLQSVLENLALYSFEVNGATWTLNAEAFATLLIFASFLVAKRGGLPVLCLFLLVCLVATRHLPPRDTLGLFRLSAFSFALGILIPTALGKAVTDRMPVAGVWLALFGMFFASHLLPGNNGTMTTITEICSAVVVAMLFYERAPALGRFLARPTAIFLGTISYSVYLFNVPFINAWHVLFEPSKSNLIVCLVAGAIVTALTIPIAWAVYMWIERPAIQFGKQLFTGKSASSTERKVKFI